MSALIASFKKLKENHFAAEAKNARSGVPWLKKPGVIQRVCSPFTRENLIPKTLSKWLYVTGDIKVDFNGMKLLS